MAMVNQKVLKSGFDSFSQTPMKGARMLENHRQLLRINRAHIFLDELHQDYDARGWYNLDPVFRHIITQHRKYDQVLHWSAQSWEYMDPFVRRNTDFVWQHTAVFRDPDTGKSRFGIHRAKKISGVERELKRRRPKILAKKWILIRPKIFNTYDSYKKIALTSKHVTDQELEAITDPYDGEVIEDLTAAQAAVHGIRDLVPSEFLEDPEEEEKDKIRALKAEHEAQDDGDLIEGQQPPDHGDPIEQIPNPRRGLFGKWIHRRDPPNKRTQ